MSTSTAGEEILQFAPLQSFVSPTFWHKLAEIKLDLDRLDDKPRLIAGYYTNRNAKSCLLEVDYTAFNGDFKAPKFCFQAHGIIFNKNTIEEFKTCDKNALLKEQGLKLLKDIQSDAVLDDPSLLARFFILSFADLKDHNYYYWFAFPCPLTSTLSVESPVEKLSNHSKFATIKQILNACSLQESQQNFFVLRAAEGQRKCISLKEFIENFKENIDLDNVYFCFADNSEHEYPSWLMRIYVAFVLYKCNSLVGKTLQFLGLRFDNHMSPDLSLLWQVKQNQVCNFEDMDQLKFVGWELNKNQKPQPRLVSMRESMDPLLLTENSINLNLKLMKWRLLPDLNLDTIANTKCLLFGAGTLGCAVSRMLLGWGFKHITFIDNGKVGLANPVRQYLYTFEDAVKGNVMKADAAAACMKKINPGTISTGHVMQIPMPGHTVGNSLRAQTENDLKKLKELVQEHDVMFLLTDSRESRWLPTLLGAAYGKIVINSALGFDSYVVQRHGATRPTEPQMDMAKQHVEMENLKCIPGQQLGCYFCNDVTAPGNSLKDRTLDQQCTVTRPGVSNLAASYAVELLVSILQHPLKEMAPAYYATSRSLAAAMDSPTKTPEGILGIIPHSIRGSLSNFENMLPATEKFVQCIACSEQILNEFRKQDNEFLFKVFESAKFLEDLTGISDYKDLKNEIIEFDDSDMDLSDD
ncbi:ubiquitin-like modifier-activating enzyme ATG7 [Stomoxys calcitrans]|uniref:ubiquitin-like modifier-activating enzyme ATG7 n=1 Tax=Stomoxys calcitrans TaxID=35570 RepID=UPI0027E29C49|nr:ubiquitin-like modifier-activating enzyme ATG7 [Stomoxys calcitrans]